MSNSKTIFKNLLSNSIAEIANKGIAFFTTLYLTRIILVDGLGIIAIANSYVIYLTLFVNLGFNFIAIRDVSKDKSDKNIIKYVNHITSIRLLFAIISFILYFVFLYFLNKPIDEKIVMFICGFNVFSTALQLDWVYQAIEKMEIIALRQLLTGVLNLLGISILVNNKSDIHIAMSVMVVTLLLNSIWMLILYLKIYKNFSFSFDKIFWKYLLLQTLQPAIINLSLIINNYVNLNIFSILSTNEHAGYFSIAFKLFTLFMIPATIIQVTYFPIISRANTFQEKQDVMKNYSRLLYFVGSFITVFVFVYSEFFIGLFGPKLFPAEITLKILMLSLILTYLDTINIFPLIAWKKDRIVMIANLSANFISIGVNLILIPMYHSKGAAIALVCSEFLIFIITSIWIYKETKQIFVFRFLGYIVLALISVTPYLLFINSNFVLIFMITSVIIYGLLNLGFKTVTIKELKGLIQKR